MSLSALNSLPLLLLSSLNATPIYLNKCFCVPSNIISTRAGAKVVAFGFVVERAALCGQVVVTTRPRFHRTGLDFLFVMMRNRREKFGEIKQHSLRRTRSRGVIGSKLDECRASDVSPWVSATCPRRPP